MGKVTMGAQDLIYPRLILLIGANVNDKPNFMAAGMCGIVHNDPWMISVAILRSRYTHAGLIQNSSFSVNIPSGDLIKETIYCGTMSGSKVNKAEACQFNVFYGKLNNAPLIEQCPVNFECKVVHVLDLGSRSLFIGTIEETYVSETCIIHGKPDIDRIRPIIRTAPGLSLYAFRQVADKALNAGDEVNK